MAARALARDSNSALFYAADVANGGDRTWIWFVLALVLVIAGAVIPTLYFLLN